MLEQSRNHEEVKRQAGIAQEARQNYERELQQHSKSIESISKLKEDLVAWKDSSANYRQQARTSESKLQSELSSWTTIKTRLSEEMEQLKQRIQDLDEQNRLLHSQLEQVTSQALKIQERSTSSSE